MTIARGLAVAPLLTLLISSGLFAQNVLQPLPGQSLSAVPLVASTSRSTSLTEMTIRWLANSPESPLKVMARRRVASHLVRERDPQLSPDELVVIATDTRGTAIGWQHVKDPRVIRAEAPGIDGVLSGQWLRRTLAEFVVAVPDDLAAAELRIYETSWTGRAWTLTPLGTVSAASR